MIRIIIYISIIASATLAQSVRDYRSDYEYNSKINAFYKLHTEEVPQGVAVETCEAESATLIATSPPDVSQAHGMLKQFPDIGDMVWAADDSPTDLEDEQKNNLEKYSDPYGHRQCEVVTRDGEVQKLDCGSAFPFICKMDVELAQYNRHCEVFSKGYQYIESIGSCYRISSAALSWNQAYAECQAEGAHLLVLNSELEHTIVHNLTHFAPKISRKAHSPWYWYAGIRAEKTKDGSPLVYKTIFGQTLQEAGYDEWSEGEPNNWNGNELCGSIFTNDGKYNDLTCSHYFAFICEKEIKNKKS